MIIADSGFWIALANQKDRYHAGAKKALVELKEPLVTTWPVISETCHILLKRIGNHAQVSFLQAIGKNVCRVWPLEGHHATFMADLCGNYANLPMDAADASLVMLAAQLGHGRIFSTDQRDFNAYRWKQKEPFQNLLPAPE